MYGRSPSFSSDLSHAKYELERFLIGGEFDLYEDGRLTARVEPGNSVAEISYGKLIFSAWGEGWARSWRIVGCQLAENLLRLRCTKRMNRMRCTLELRRPGDLRPVSGDRKEFAAKLCAMIENTFSGIRVERSVVARDDRRHLPGVHTRLVLREGKTAIAAIAAGHLESQTTIDSMLGAGILWLEGLRAKTPQASRLMIFSPKGRTGTLASRLTAVNPEPFAISLYEVDESEAVFPVRPYDQGDLADNFRRAARGALWSKKRTTPEALERAVYSIVQLSPRDIEVRYRGNSIGLSIRGLEFARVSIRRQTIEFGIGELEQKLDQATRPQLEELVAEILSSRVPGSARPGEPLFRLQSERWLESIIRNDVTALDPSLDPRFVYSQVPTYRGEHRSFIDLLAITEHGRLVVIELKTSEDPELPFQGLDYWLRVNWHRQRNDFKRRGYFRGVDIVDQVPLLYLVAPLFRFHSSTATFTRLIAPNVPLHRIAINQNWRHGVKVRLREILS